MANPFTNLTIVNEIDWDTFGVKIEGDNVVRLGLYNQGLKALPELITNLKSLTFLGLNDNNLTTLPESMQNLSKLEMLLLKEDVRRLLYNQS